MKNNSKFFKTKKFLPVDNFFMNVLYDKKFGYYTNNCTLGKKGDFITSPKISKLFSEIIAIWIISAWQILGKPKYLNVVELGPGDGSMIKDMLSVFKKFPEFNSSKKISLYEKSDLLKKIQKKNINSSKVYWLDNLKNLRNGPVVFFGNEFLDAIPIKQFKVIKGQLFEKYYSIKMNGKIEEVFKKASKKDAADIMSYKSLRKLKFVEYPKEGLKELKKIIKKITKLKGCLLMIDYGYLGSLNKDTYQSVWKHKKNPLLHNLGKADITSLVNFSLLNEYFIKNNLKVKKIVTQQRFLKNMGIIERANLISKKMKFSEQSNLYNRLRRLLSKNSMGEIFKVSLTYKSKSNNFYGFN